ncbi:hypothetical protein RhiirA4_390617, partial [Rhizophagus irregularis]
MEQSLLIVSGPSDGNNKFGLSADIDDDDDEFWLFDDDNEEDDDIEDDDNLVKMLRKSFIETGKLVN